MRVPSSSSFTAFAGHQRIAAGTLAAVALAIKRAIERDHSAGVLIFDDTTGRSIDIDIRGSEEEVLARFGPLPEDEPGQVAANAGAGGVRGRGRPKLGVVSREITLLPRHWKWLATQPGGASVALRKLVEQARRTHVAQDRSRETQERGYHFISAIAGDLPGFEEATRALFAGEQDKFAGLIAAWPADVRQHAMLLAFGADITTSDLSVTTFAVRRV